MAAAKKSNRKKTTATKSRTRVTPKRKERVGVATLGRVKNFGLWKSLAVIAAVVAVGAGVLYFSEASGPPKCTHASNKPVPFSCNAAAQNRRRSSVSAAASGAKREAAVARAQLGTVSFNLNKAYALAAKSKVSAQDARTAEIAASTATRYTAKMNLHYRSAQVYLTAAKSTNRDAVSVASQTKTTAPNLAPLIAQIQRSSNDARYDVQVAFRKAAAAQVLAKETKRKYVASQQNGGGGSGSSPLAIGQRMAAQRGWTGKHWQDLVTIWSRESGWNPRAKNRSSGACGIPQALPCSKMGGAFPNDTTGQIRWGLDYIQGRYGNPSAALQHSYSHNWY